VEPDVEHDVSVMAVGGWLTTLALSVVVSVTTGAKLSTTVLLRVLGVAPAIVMVFLGGGAPSPSVAEILHAAETKTGR
jgi:hypothetical protein